MGSINENHLTNFKPLPFMVFAQSKKNIKVDLVASLSVISENLIHFDSWKNCFLFENLSKTTIAFVQPILGIIFYLNRQLLFSWVQ